MDCNCGKPKCDGQCGSKSPAVLQINNPAEYITFHKVSIPAAMGDSTTNPPKIGAYRNALVYYEADHTSWMYSTDGIPTLITGEKGDKGDKGDTASLVNYYTKSETDAAIDEKIDELGVPDGFFTGTNTITGTGATRPTTFLSDGMTFFDTTLNKPIWYYNGSWYDATGTQV